MRRPSLQKAFLRRGRRLSALILAGALLLPGCSLVTIEFPDEPLSEREMNARHATHRFVDHFTTAVQETADAVSEDAGEEIELQALRWKIGSMTALRAAAFHASPRDAMVDTWAYSVQMAAFFAEGAGQGAFGGQHQEVIGVSASLRDDITTVAKRFAPPGEEALYEEFVQGYAAQHPLRDIMAPRESAIGEFYAFLGIDPEDAVPTVGTLPQVVHDFGSRISLVAEEIGDQTAWRTELFLRESGVDRGSFQAELDRFGSRMERVALVAEQSPALVDDALLRLHDELEILIAAIDQQRGATMEALAQERTVLLEAVSTERAAAMQDLESYSEALVADVMDRVAGIINIAVLGVVALVVVIFGVPFGLGVLVGRVTGRARS